MMLLTEAMNTYFNRKAGTMIMKIKYIGRFMDVTDSLKDYADKKLAKLEWFFDENADAQIKFTQEKGAKNIAEITIVHKHMIFRAEEITGDMYASIDKAVDKLSRQIRRHRTKLDKRLHVPAPEVIPEADEPAVEEEERKVVRVKHFNVKPMSVEDAISRMEGIQCGFRGTSCPDQLAHALKEALAGNL